MEMLRPIPLLTFILLNSYFTLCFSQKAASSQMLSPSLWTQDVNFLQERILQLHPNPFLSNPSLDQKSFNKLFDELRKKLPEWDENKIVAELTRLVALMNDGHSSIDPFASPPSFYEFKFFPLMVYYFPEGLFVINAPKEHENLIGCRITAIDHVPIVHVMDKLRPLISRDYGNEASFKDGIRNFVTLAQYLNGTGIIDNPNEATYSLENHKGSVTHVTFSSVALQELFSKFDMGGNEGKPLYRQNPMKPYWFRFLESENVLYIKHTFQIIDQSYKPDLFCSEMQEIVDSKNPSKIILDLRQGQGGNIGTLKPLYDFLTQPKINQPGKLFVLMDRRSQSAGTVLAIRLEMISKAILIGEPAVSAVNFFDNDVKFGLPNSKLKFGISTHFQNAGFPNDTRIQFSPEILIEQRAADYFSGKDSVLSYALSYTPVDVSKSSESAATLAGTYQYSYLQTLDIKKINGEWRMIIEDIDRVKFLNTTLYPQNDGRFITDVDGLTVSPNNGQLHLQAPWLTMTLKSLPSSYINPQQLIFEGNIDAAINELRQIHGNVPKEERTDFESKINGWGYRFVRKNQLADAIKLFKLNTELFPKSANVWDSLGEVMALTGNKAEAVHCYEKALEITPGLPSALKALQTLK